MIEKIRNDEIRVWADVENITDKNKRSHTEMVRPCVEKEDNNYINY